MTVGGLHAREQVSRPGACGENSGDETISVDVARAYQDNYYAIWACLRGPDIDQEAAQIQRMLASTTFPNG